MTGMVLVSPPDISYSQLLFDERETRQIFNFFWPERSEKIDAMSITDERRHLAQKILIVAIDSTYAMGYVEILMKTMFSGRPFKGLAAMGKKLATSYFKHWWKHATRDNLKHPLIAEVVRRNIAYHYANDIENDSRRECPAETASVLHGGD